LRLPANPVASAEAKRAFERRELVQAVRLCATMNQPDLTKKLVAFMAEHADTDVDAMLVADLGKDIGRPSLGVFAAKKAMQRGIVLTGDGYPVPQTPVNLYIERPLVLGVSRQESEFDTQIRSPSGAVGLMQLMLPTAKETARKNGLPFNRDQLTDGNYNMMLGSLYLLRMIKSYDGSYIMAIAAYNAGPGNVRNWAEQFGTPGNAIDNAVNWIEKIPFTETRNYVQRVLENTQVYRHLENGKARLNLAEDLER
jgi:soluble lytic murein transglycosylase